MKKLETVQLKVYHVVLVGLGLIALIGVFAWLYLQSMAAPMIAIPDGSTGFGHLATLYGDENYTLGETRSVYAADNLIYISDTSNRRVVVLDEQGRYVRSIGDTTQDNWPGLSFPYGIVVVEEKIYVADAGTQKVTVFDLEGNFLSFFGEKDLVKPVNIVFKNQHFYFTDVGRQQIVILDKQGDEVYAFGVYGKDGNPGELNYPNGLAVGNDGRIYVADTNNSRIQVFTSEGEFLIAWQKEVGSSTSIFSAPMNISLDKNNNLYVADAVSNRIVVLNQLGEISRTIAGVQGENAGPFSLPTGVYVDVNQRLLVSDTGNRRLVIYNLE
ncbi:6-bladed beta-propeller [Dethiobacter alkaliphilus]|uniref:6-bladed beta-propeller n=1 Tax=Dethiobacter alkaliphilus TaxID=427926 RepID=UPI002226E652|nr:6-bladed beta-propeller [Dethiobacter alkaliphilus]MCW3491151.1 6-bladed beta-propeller [Dethiobacter alkaliphilus]